MSKLERPIAPVAPSKVTAAMKLALLQARYVVRMEPGGWTPNSRCSMRLGINTLLFCPAFSRKHGGGIFSGGGFR